ncbi:hypothetical protein NDA16_004268 [Ustilago loliicola]|nr:hypothetical protein NDA16_004268 [Ustilago loliicola]
MRSVAPAAAAGAGAGWGARLKRAASSLTKSNSGAATLGGDRYTAAAKPVVTMRNAAPRSTEAVEKGEREELPDDFIVSLADDDSPFVFSETQALG